MAEKGECGMQYRTGRQFLLGLPYGCDLEPTITEFVRQHDIRMAHLTCLGSLLQARVGFYDHHRREYVELAHDEGLEISSGVGNVSIRDGKPFVHLHVALTDERGRTTGGHVMAGTMVFVGEVAITELVGPEQERTFDEQTGLYLWDHK